MLNISRYIGNPKIARTRQQTEAISESNVGILSNPSPFVILVNSMTAIVANVTARHITAVSPSRMLPTIKAT